MAYTMERLGVPEEKSEREEGIIEQEMKTKDR